MAHSGPTGTAAGSGSWDCVIRRGVSAASPHALSVLVTAIAIAAPLIVVTAAGTLAAGTQFGAYQLTDLGSEPEAIAIGDVTGDGRNDVVVTTGYDNDPANDFKLMVLAGQADGTLAAPSPTPRPARTRIGPRPWTSATSTATAAPTWWSGCLASASRCSPGQADGTLGAPDVPRQRGQPQGRRRRLRRQRPRADRRHRLGHQHRHDLRRRRLRPRGRRHLRRQARRLRRPRGRRRHRRRPHRRDRHVRPVVAAQHQRARPDRRRVRRRGTSTGVGDRRPDQRHRRRRGDRRRPRRRPHDVRRQQPERPARHLRCSSRRATSTPTRSRTRATTCPGAVEVADVDQRRLERGGRRPRGLGADRRLSRPGRRPVRGRGPVPGPVLERRPAARARASAT